MTLSGAGRVAAVIGDPVRHSLSPRLHGYWLSRYLIDGAYVPLPVHAGRLESALQGLLALGFAGANVTVPHKEQVRLLCDEVDALGHRVGAVNTIVIDDGKLKGTNTDVFGFAENIAPALGEDRSVAVVLGAGGAARAVVVALQNLGFETIRIVNRTPERARALCNELEVETPPLAWGSWDAALDGAAILVNSTSLGMAGQPALDVDLAPLPAHALVTDIVYTPLETALLAAARARGNPVVDGLGMLLHQARPGFHAWFGVDPEVDAALRQHVLAGLADPAMAG